MAFSYDPPGDRHVRQGEILKTVIEYHVASPPRLDAEAEQAISLLGKTHPLVIIVSQDCDILWDHSARFGDQSIREDKLLQHLLFCDLYTPDEVRSRGSLSSDLWKRVRQNQDERYHHFELPDPNSAVAEVPELYADFKQVFSLPTDFTYRLIEAGSTRRLGVLPGPYLHDFTHRLFGFLGRIALPDAE